MRRHWVVALVVTALVALACKAEGGGGGGGGGDPDPPPARGLPSSMVALGDSLTAGYGSCLVLTSCPRNSWATGNGTQVNSHYRRILRDNPAIRDRARNLARPGVGVSALSGQVDTATNRRADYVTILIGANDACRGDMTSVEEFRDQLDRALAALKRGMPRARLLVVSLPDVYRVWEIGRDNRLARAAWRAGVCPNLLRDPTSDDAADVERRLAFRDRVTAYNRQLRSACADYGSRCRFDDISSFNFELTMLSAIDFFHPNAAGQTELADQTYPGSFRW
jgi:lysophospholipase L1-like esterase